MKRLLFVLFLVPALSWAQKPTVIISGDGSATVVSVGTQGPPGANIPAGGAEGNIAAKVGGGFGWSGAKWNAGLNYSFDLPVLTIAADNCTAPPFTFAGDTTTGVCSSVAGTLNLRVAGANQFSLTSTGLTTTVPLLLPDGTAANSSWAFTSDPDRGIRKGGSGLWFQMSSSDPVMELATWGISFKASQPFGWAPDDALTGARDVLLYRDAPATLQLGSDAATATGQTVKGPDSTGANVAGGNLTLRGGAGKSGNAAGGNLVLGGGAPFGSGERGAVLIEDGGTKPTCAAGIRGAVWYDAGAAGVADTSEVCTKNSSNEYAWRAGTSSVPVAFSSWYADKTVTVPGPTATPTLEEQVGYGNTFTNSTVYQVAYTYLAWNGETGLSPTSSFTAKNNQAIAVMPFASLSDNSKYAVGSYIYISADGGTTWHRAIGAFTDPAMISFGDDSGGQGGALINYKPAGAAPPGGAATTTTKSGLTVSPPTAAPTVLNLHANAAATYYGAYAYLCGDGTETALSPVSSGLALSVGNTVLFARNEEPPSGAVAVRVYLGTSATPASLHLQTTWPLHYAKGMIEDYSAAGAAPSAGAAQSIVSSVQQAYDTMMNTGITGKIIVGPGPVALKTPLILRLRNASAAAISGIEIEGVGAHSVSGTPAAGRLYYDGTVSTAVVGVLAAGTGTSWRGLDVLDPNLRLSVALAAADFSGGGGFQSRWYDSKFEARKAGSIGYQIAIQSGRATHSISEQHFRDVFFSGDAWAIDVHAGQTIDIDCTNCTGQSWGNSNSANSGFVRTATQGLSLHGFEGAASAVGYGFFLTNDTPIPNGGKAALAMENVFTDGATACAHLLHVSGVSVNYSALDVRASLFGSATADRFAFYTGSSTKLTSTGNKGLGNGWVNWVSTTALATDRAEIIQTERTEDLFGFGATYGFKVAPTNATKVLVNLLSPERGADLTISGNVLTPTNQVHHVGAGLVKTITVPGAMTLGTITLIPDAAFTYDATGNIVGTGTAVVGRAMTATYDPSSAKWYMSY